MSEIKIKQAQFEDIPTIQSILLDTVNWLNEMNQPLLKAEDVVWSMLSKSYSINDFYITFIDGKPSRCIVIIDLDPLFWPNVTKGDLLSIHKLAVTNLARKTGVSPLITS